MNKLRWADPETPLELVALKLCEEAGEVGNVISDNLMRHTGPLSRQEVDALVEECEHVIFLAGVIKARAKKIRKPGA